MSEQLVVLAFPEYMSPAQGLAKALGAACHRVELKRFPDGESCVRISESVPKRIIVCRSLFEPNDKLVELILVTATLRKLGAQSITLVAPYLCYMRQDKSFNPGEAVSQQIIGRFIAEHVDNLLTVDPHLHRTRHLDQAVPTRRAVAISAASLIGPFLRQHVEDPILVGPDSESRQWVRKIAESGNMDYLVANKQRSGDRSVSITLPEADLAGRRAILVDDVASTGTTLAVAAQLLVQSGASEVCAFVTHGLFVGDAILRMRAAGIHHIWSTDSIPHPSNVISLAPLLAQEIRQMTD
jgi:ribose-phosphate pyrophosphokinase